MATENENESLTKVESLCPNCYENGSTTFLFCQIPYFKEIIVSSFECVHCGHVNNNVQSGCALQNQGITITLNVEGENDLNRQVVKGEHASLKLTEMDFEIPPETQKAICSTIEGMIRQAASALESDQPIRKIENPELAEKLDAVISELKLLYSGAKFPFTVLVDDPSGNSFIEPISPCLPDKQISYHYYNQTAEHYMRMGYQPLSSDASNETAEPENQSLIGKKGADIPERLRCGNWDLNKTFEHNIADNSMEGVSFQVNCPYCRTVGNNNVCEIDIPGFRKCTVMAFVCENCGAKETEVKPGGAFGEKGKKWTLTITDEPDINRDVLISDYASLSIPSVQLEMTIGGAFTTVEGLISRALEHLEKSNPFSTGDSASEDTRSSFMGTLQKLRTLISDRSAWPFKIILTDPVDFSFIGRRFNTVQPSEPDRNLVEEYFARSESDDEDLGIKQMKTENY